jgi:hypothetical protein
MELGEANTGLKAGISPHRVGEAQSNVILRPAPSGPKDPNALAGPLAVVLWGGALCPRQFPIASTGFEPPPAARRV